MKTDCGRMQIWILTSPLWARCIWSCTYNLPGRLWGSLSGPLTCSQRERRAHECNKPWKAWIMKRSDTEKQINLFRNERLCRPSEGRKSLHPACFSSTQIKVIILNIFPSDSQLIKYWHRHVLLCCFGQLRCLVRAAGKHQPAGVNRRSWGDVGADGDTDGYSLLLGCEVSQTYTLLK